MPARTRSTQQSTGAATAAATAPLRPAVVDDRPSLRFPETSATTTSRAVAPGVTLPNRRLADGRLGEAHLVWRCLDCGETGSLTEFPSYCPDCRAGRESVAYWVED